jgi:hypothetical protein
MAMRLDPSRATLPTNPMTDAEVEAKFRDRAAFAGWSTENSERAIGLV